MVAVVAKIECVERVNCRRCKRAVLFAKSSGARKALNTVSAAWEASADVACVAKSGTRSKRYAQDIAGIVAKANVRNFNVKEDRNRTACSKMYHELKVDGVWCIGASSLLLLGNTRLVHHGRKHNRRHLACPGLWFYPTTCNQSRAKLRLYHRHFAIDAVLLVNVITCICMSYMWWYALKIEFASNLTQLVDDLTDNCSVL
jgi:hypothetical protein